LFRKNPLKIIKGTKKAGANASAMFNVGEMTAINIAEEMK